VNKKLSGARQVTVTVLLVALMAVLVWDLVKIQIFEKDEYEARVSSVSSRTASIPASRGEILDCNGNKLVYNEQGYALVFDGSYFPTSDENEERNKIIISLIRMFEKKGIEWEDILPLELKNGEVAFKEDSDAVIKEMKSRDMLNLNEYASAQNCYDALVKAFELEKYSPAESLKIASVRYGMMRIGFGVGVTYTFAQDVPDETVSAIMENSSFYRGVDNRIVPVRTYSDGSIAPHILGLTGAMDAESYAELKDKGYKMSDSIGKSGIELAMEEYLKGKDGEMTIYTDDKGNRTSEVTKAPEQGSAVVLTIDSGLQKVAQDALKDALESYAGKIGNRVPNAGAVVVLSCKDSSVLASASYPTYDISTYAENAAKLNTATASPLWNRALMSVYACGSTAKPSVAIAALEEGIIDEKFTVYCNGSYTYMGQHFKCEQAHATAFVNVINAINESCNTFFLEVGDMLGIEKMNEYRIMLGLGSKTGSEVNEAAGILDSPEYRASLNQEWLPGYTVQSAIGQAGNAFSPVQLANYVNTIANGGTRYRVHFVKSVKTADYSQTLIENGAEVMCDTGISPETLDIVKRGMLKVGTIGYCAPYFDYLPVKVACKTGTSQEYRKINGYSTKINNGFLIAFAPYDDPQIAIAAVGEGMISGKYMAPVIASVVEYYCGMSDTIESAPEEGELIP